ncbi:cytochrome P450 [Coprinellus micaceus]|uniref:Cytochrome P450 n=1 Tax=Coprinellus micaceus TaxID=71717 RepID=A0A4Y7T7T8_COPMI|nr:cytochrome P450 [Coprinellus micaceus]
MPRETPLTSATLAAGVALALTPIAWRLLHRKRTPLNSLPNVPGPNDGSFIAGHMSLLFSNDSWDYHRDLCENYGQTCRVKGLFGEDFLYTFDPKAMHHIFVKASAMSNLISTASPYRPMAFQDQYIYEEASFFTANGHVFFGPGLLSVTGDHHKKQRKMLNPVFSVAHLRHMVPTFFKIGEQLRSTFLAKVSNGDQEIEIVSWMTRIALEIFGQSGFGTSFAPVTEDSPEHPYASSVKNLTALMTVTALPRMFILPPVQKYNIGGRWLQRKIIDILPWKLGHQLRDIVDMMHETSSNVFESKRKAMSEEGDSSGEDQKKDILGILMRENSKSSEADKLPDEEVIAQMSTLMFAAMDTTSSALARILHLLALHQNVQDKLRAELRDAHENFGAQPDHDDLVNLPYLDAVCRETLRLYPPVATITRETQADVFLPLSKPMKGIDETEMSEVFLPKNSNVFISIRASNTDPNSVNDAHVPGVYSHLMTFIGGGRSCIGFKFSQLEMKVILYSLIKQFRFSPPKEKIYWQMTFIASPTVDPELKDLRPRMPLTVSLVDDA